MKYTHFSDYLYALYSHFSDNIFYYLSQFSDDKQKTVKLIDFHIKYNSLLQKKSLKK